MKSKMLAVMAVIALAFAGVAVFTEMNANDADAGHAPVAFAYGYNASGVYEKMKVLAYDDNVILVDTTAMDLNDETMFYVGLTANSTSATVEENRIGPIAAQNGQLWIDGTGFLTATEHTAVALYAYSNTATPLGTADIEYTNTPAALDLKTNYHKDPTATPKKWTSVNYDASAEGAETYEAYTDAQEIVRFGAVELDQNTDTSADKKFYGVNYGYGLNGWALSFADNATTNPIVIQPTASIAIEDVIFTMADGIDRLDADHKALTNPIGGVTANKITLYAIWGELIFSLEVGDADNVDTTTTPYTFTDFGTDNVAVADKVIASVTSMVTKDSFALLRIQQTAAGNYTYGFDVYYGVKDSSGSTTWTKDESATHDYAKIKMISNGVFKVSEVKADIMIAITVNDTETVESTAYAFNVDQIRNDTVAQKEHGFVNISLDLFDYKAIVNSEPGSGADAGKTLNTTQQIAIDGTYYTTLGEATEESGDNTIRVYGNLRSLLTAGDVTVAGYIDLATAAASQIVDYQYDNTHKSADSALQLTTTDSVFDLSYTLEDDYCIYAAQGVFNTVVEKVPEEGETTYVVSPVQKTPWALYKA